MKRLSITLRDITKGIVFVIFAAFLILGGVFGPFIPRGGSVNYGFGSEWDCSDPGKISALTCIKRSH
jgi:hypothetical protein